jgi:hypothetical protein
MRQSGALYWSNCVLCVGNPRKYLPSPQRTDHSIAATFSNIAHMAVGDTRVSSLRRSAALCNLLLGGCAERMGALRTAEMKPKPAERRDACLLEIRDPIAPDRLVSEHTVGCGQSYAQIRGLYRSDSPASVSASSWPPVFLLHRRSPQLPWARRRFVTGVGQRFIKNIAK